MKILVLSDTHGWEEELVSFLNPLRSQVDLILHAGDSELPVDAAVLMDVKTVAGNCDVFAAFPSEETFDLVGHRIQLTHGHHEGVKSSLGELVRKAQDNAASIAIYGHTHIPKVQRFDNVITINPGSLRLPKGSFEGSYCLIELSEDTVSVDYYTIDGKAIEELQARFTSR
ncbi:MULTISPECIES: metallophosphoesterase family protein [Shouchella]|uniref:Phosphoesterase n=2 Tax=Shouchella TaxID=2893057 RepID=A0ABY7W6S4_9BACI|nr:MULTISPECIES: metallophosphoesterase [Shouchella]MED4129247.1 metallophosphoesterase [Shouchella miscanthi]WDF04134.1 metallophosphoesterase [Shouchella hunanensis]GAF24065.1 phosphoesterase [Bacillus sp. JCM 19047]